MMMMKFSIPVVLAMTVLVGSVHSLGGDFGQGGFHGLPDDYVLPESTKKAFSPAEGVTPAQVVIEEVVSYPGEEKKDLIVLRNIGGQTADMTGWQLSDTSGVSPLIFGEGDCSKNTFLAPAAKLMLWHLNDENPCGLSFPVGFRDSINLHNKNGELVTRMSWNASKKGTCFRRRNDGTYATLSEGSNILEILEEMGQFSVLLRALNAFGLDEKVVRKSDPDYKGTEAEYLRPVNQYIQPHFPSWFGYEADRSILPTTPSAPSVVEGVPKLGPYTVLAPTDAAFDAFRSTVSGPGRPAISIADMLALPEMDHILEYHILPGMWTSNFFENNRAIGTAKGVKVVTFADAAMGEGKLQLHDSCVDKPTPDPFSCTEQVEFGKCMDPFMTSPLAAQWKGGFCELSCERCTCDAREGSSCAAVVDADVMASNGVVHGIDRVLFPPPRFEDAVETAVETPAESDASAVLIAARRGTVRGTGVRDAQPIIQMSSTSGESIATTG